MYCMNYVLYKILNFRVCYNLKNIKNKIPIVQMYLVTFVIISTYISCILAVDTSTYFNNSYFLRHPNLKKKKTRTFVASLCVSALGY